MAKTRLIIAERSNILLYMTRVENIFITEYLPDAPGDYVKVYLFCLMYGQFDQEIDIHNISMTLGVSEKMIEAAWEYWAKQGLVRLTETEDGCRNIEFVRKIEELYGKSRVSEDEAADKMQPATGGVNDSGTGNISETENYSEEDGEESADSIIARLINNQLKEIFDKYQMITGRTISRQETSRLTDAVKVYNIEPDILNFAIDYCADLQKYSVDYIFKVALRWTEEGCRDVAQVKQMLDRHSRRNAAYGHVFRALGFNRLPNPADREMMDKWFDEMEFSLKEVLDACYAAAGIRDPNLRYVNKVLENRMLEKGGIDTRKLNENNSASGAARTEQKKESKNQARVSRRVLREYFDHIRAEEEERRSSRIAKVKREIPEMKELLDEESRMNLEMISIDPNSPNKRESLREKRRRTEEKKKALLINNGYPADYLDKHFKCRICKDTGFTDEGKVCTCCKVRADEAYRWNQETEMN